MKITVTQEDIDNAIAIHDAASLVSKYVSKYDITAKCPVALGASRSIDKNVTWGYHEGTIHEDNGEHLPIVATTKRAEVYKFVVDFDDERFGELEPLEFEADHRRL